jgi:hypothetical protein
MVNSRKNPVIEEIIFARAEEIFGRVNAPKKLVVFSLSDHRMSRAADQQTFLLEATL